MLELTNGLVENVPYTNKIGKILLLIMYVVFLKYIFVENFNSLFLETVTIKFGGPRAEGRHMGPRAEKNKYPETFLLKNQTQNVVEKLFPDPFLKNQNWDYLWINSLKFYAICF